MQTELKNFAVAFQSAQSGVPIMCYEVLTHYFLGIKDNLQIRCRSILEYEESSEIRQCITSAVTTLIGGLPMNGHDLCSKHSAVFLTNSLVAIKALCLAATPSELMR